LLVSHLKKMPFCFCLPMQTLEQFWKCNFNGK